MKRLMTLLLAAGLVLGATSAAKAVDFKMTGLWVVGGVTAHQAFDGEGF